MSLPWSSPDRISFLLLSQAWKRIDGSIDHRKGDEVIVEEEVDNFGDSAIEVRLKATVQANV